MTRAESFILAKRAIREAARAEQILESRRAEVVRHLSAAWRCAASDLDPNDIVLCSEGQCENRPIYRDGDGIGLCAACLRKARE